MAAPKPITRPGQRKPKVTVFKSPGGRSQNPGTRGVVPKSNGNGSTGSSPTGDKSILGLFPSTSVSQSEIAKLLGGARTQVEANYAGTALPPQSSYLQPFVDRRAANSALATKAADYMTAASSNAQNLSGAFTNAVATRLAANQDATFQGGGSAPAAGAIPPPAQETIPMNMVGSSWTNLFNAYVPAQATRAQEANQQVDIDSNKAIAEYRAAQDKRTTDMQAAIQQLYQANLDTLRGQKSDDYKNAVALYSILGKEKYQKMLLDERKSEFNRTAGQTDRRLNQADTTISNTEAYRQANLTLQRQKALKVTGIDTTGALSILMNGKLAAKGGLKLGPQGQLGGNYLIYPLLQSAADSPTGVAIYNTKSPIKRFIKYGDKVPTPKEAHGKVVLASLAYPHTKAGQERGATAASYAQAVQNLRAKYGARITSKWLALYFPPPPGAS